MSTPNALDRLGAGRQDTSRGRRVVALIKIWHGHTVVHHPPMGLLCVGGALRQAGYDVRIFHWSKFDAVREVQALVESSPFLIGVSIITGDPARTILDVCQALKHRLPDVPIVFGGVHPTLEPVQCLQEAHVDYVCVNDGERAMVALADALSAGGDVTRIPGLGFKKNGRIQVNPFERVDDALDRYGMDWTLVDIERYIRPYEGLPRVLMGYVTSRGCPHQCGFCYNHFFNERRWRGRNTQTVIQEIDELAQAHRLDGILFYDDNFTANKKRALEILKSTRVKGTHIETRVDYIDDAFLQELKAADVHTIFLGIECGSNRLMKLMSKGFSADDTYRALERVKHYQFALKLSLIVGIPTETLAEYRQTLKLVIWCFDNLPQAGFSIGFYLPYPGTPLFDLCVQRGFERPKDFAGWEKLDRWGNQDTPIPWTDGSFVTSGEVKKLRQLLEWMRACRNSTRLEARLVYPILRYRFVNSGSWHIRMLGRLEGGLRYVLRAYRATRALRTAKA